MKLFGKITHHGRGGGRKLKELVVELFLRHGEDLEGKKENVMLQEVAGNCMKIYKLHFYLGRIPCQYSE